MKKLSLMLIAIMLVAILSGCNSMARSYGGTTNIDLPKGQKLVNVTWKEDSIWYLTKPMTTTDTVETYLFHEDSNYGIMEGTVILKESK